MGSVSFSELDGYQKRRTKDSANSHYGFVSLFVLSSISLLTFPSYVPIKVDYSDLYDVMTFFVGTPDGRGSHDEIAAKLAAQGKEWARTHWRKEDMASYMFRLMLGKLNLTRKN